MTLTFHGRVAAEAGIRETLDVPESVSVEPLLPKLNEKPVLNMANYGRIGGSLSDKEKITETVYLSPEDKEVVKQVFALGYDFNYQPLPDDAPQSLKSLIGG